MERDSIVPLLDMLRISLRGIKIEITQGNVFLKQRPKFDLIWARNLSRGEIKPKDLVGFKMNRHKNVTYNQMFVPNCKPNDIKLYTSIKYKNS